VDKEEVANNTDLVGKTVSKRTIGTPRRKWERNIKIDLKDIGREDGAGFNWLRTGTNGGLL
jgi:hypothetical protein